MSKQFTSLEKVTLIKRSLLEDVPVSQLCEENSIRPATFHQWMEEFFQNGEAAFEVSRRKRGRPPKYGPSAPVRELERKLMQKDKVLAELMADHVKLKKKLGLV
jgi:transposase-like protein